jgi:transcriptional regulator with XRE-family HTH domain
MVVHQVPAINSFNTEDLKEHNVLGKKLTEARKSADLTQKELSEKLKDYQVFVTPGAISKWEKGDAMPNPYQLLAVCHVCCIYEVMNYFTGVTPEAHDYTPELSQKGLNLLQMFKEALIASGKYAPKSRRGDPYEAVPEISVKVYNTPAAAGFGSFLDGEDFEMVSFEASKVPENADFGIRVSGNSMLPRYVSGQIVFVEKCQELYPGEVGVFVCNGNAYIKQYLESVPDESELEDYITNDGRVCPKTTLYSLNREYEQCDVHVTPNDELFIVGRVLN